MKDEFKRILINKFVALKSNMYWIVSENGEEVNTSKGVNILIEFKEYKNVSYNKILTKHKMKRIQSKLHEIGTCDVCKISMF